MKVGVYGIENQGILNCFADGLKNIGVHVIWRRHDVFTPDQVEKFDAIVVNGLRKHYTVIRDTYLAAGIPVIVTDLGYFREPIKHYQIGFNKLGWLPEFDCPDDRLKQLGITYPGCKSNEKGHILICAQMADDAAHGLSQEQLDNHYIEQIKQLKRFYPNNEIRLRKHPWDSETKHPAMDCVLDKSPSMKEAVEGCYFVISINSTAGLEAIMYGYPALVDKPCVYSELCAKNEDKGLYPDKEKFMNVMRRIAYAQWTVTEINSGIAQQFLLDTLKGIKPEITIEPEKEITEPETKEPTVTRRPRRKATTA